MRNKKISIHQEEGVLLNKTFLILSNRKDSTHE
jgi:hypothetical protein